MFMLYNFALFGVLNMMGWDQHDVEIDGDRHKVWVHNSGVVIYNQGVEK